MDPRARMLRLLTLLQTGRPWAAGDLADALGTTTRTLRRDVDFLREQGYPVRSAPGPGGHYRLSSGKALPPLMLDDDEAVAVALGLRMAATGSLGLALERDAAERSLAKLRQMLPARLRERTDALLATVESEDHERPLPAASSFRALATAAAGHRIVAFDHAKGGSVVRRTAEPYRLVAVGGRWYLFAWDLDRGDWRTFRLDRITAEETTERPFVPRELPADDLAEHVSQQFRPPAVHRVVLDLQASASAAATLLHRVDGTLEPLGETTCRYTALVDSFEWLAMVLVVSDVELTVVGPEAFGRFLTASGTRLVRAGEPFAGAGSAPSPPGSDR